MYVKLCLYGNLVMSLEIMISYNSSGPSSNYVNGFDMNMGVFQFCFAELFLNYASYF